MTYPTISYKLRAFPQIGYKPSMEWTQAARTGGKSLGFDTGVRSFPYIVWWSKDKKILAANLGGIRKISERLIGELEKAPLQPSTLSERKGREMPRAENRRRYCAKHIYL